MGHEGWHQGWRKPLREAMDWLRDAILPHFRGGSLKYLKIHGAHATATLT